VGHSHLQGLHLPGTDKELRAFSISNAQLPLSPHGCSLPAFLTVPHDDGLFVRPVRKEREVADSLRYPPQRCRPAGEEDGAPTNYPSFQGRFPSENSATSAFPPRSQASPKEGHGKPRRWARRFADAASPRAAPGHPEAGPTPRRPRRRCRMLRPAAKWALRSSTRCHPSSFLQTCPRHRATRSSAASLGKRASRASLARFLIIFFNTEWSLLHSLAVLRRLCERDDREPPYPAVA